MKYLIAGGTGLIGRALAKSLLGDGHQVTVLTRNPEKAKQVLPKGTTIEWWEQPIPGFVGHTNPPAWPKRIGEAQAIINLTGESLTGNSIPAILTDRWTSKKKQRILESRMLAGSTLSVVFEEACQYQTSRSMMDPSVTVPEVFVQSSAVGYYSPSGTQVVTEASPAGTDFLAKVCLSAESSTADLDQAGYRRIVLRTGLVLSPEGGILPLMLLPFRMLIGGPLGDGTQPIPWIHIDDQVEAIKFLTNNPEARGAYNLTAPNPVDYNQFAKIASKVLHRPNWLHIPAFALKLALGEKSNLVLQGQHALPERLLQAGYQFKYTELESALYDLT